MASSAINTLANNATTRLTKAVKILFFTTRRQLNAVAEWTPVNGKWKRALHSKNTLWKEQHLHELHNEELNKRALKNLKTTTKHHQLKIKLANGSSINEHPTIYMLFSPLYRNFYIGSTTNGRKRREQHFLQIKKAMKKEGTMERKYITIAKCKPWTWVMVPIKMYSINNIKDMRRHENHLIQRYKPQLNFIGTYKQNNKRDVYKKLRNKKLRNKRLRNKIKNFNESATTFKYKQHGNCQTVKKDMDIRRYQPHFLQLCHFLLRVPRLRKPCAHIDPVCRFK